MGHRLSKIVTRTGDDGTTGLGDGSRVAKDSARIAAIGDVDELNSTLGVLLAEELPATASAMPRRCPARSLRPRRRAVDPGVHGGDRRARRTARGRRRALQRRSRAAQGIHPARRRAVGGARTRRANRLPPRRAGGRPPRGGAAPVNDPARRYLNRLSDLLFVLARTLNRAAGRGDVLWQKDRSRGA